MNLILSQGYVIYSLRKKLKKKYAHLNGSQIKKLKNSGVEVSSIFAVKLLTCYYNSIVQGFKF